MISVPRTPTAKTAIKGERKKSSLPLLYILLNGEKGWNYLEI